MHNIVIGSRGSDLALWQANFVKDQLENLGHNVSIKIIKTKGDNIQHLSFDKIEGKGFFTKELEEQLLNGSIDLAVHSHKDLETTQPEGLKIAAVSHRANPSDILLIKPDALDESKHYQLKENAKVGTSSARRKVQLLDLRPDLELADIRGNVPTRIEKLLSGSFDAIVLASAGLERLQLDTGKLIRHELNRKDFVPAPAQGVLALQIRTSDSTLDTILAELNHEDVAACTQVERAILKGMDGGCQLPLGVYCQKNELDYELWLAYAKDVSSPVSRIYTHHAKSEQVIKDAFMLLQLEQKKKY